MSTETFFEDLDYFDHFSGITESKHFSPAPENWFVVITDVVGSTKAIDSGRYKDVNIIGAAAIACTQNAMPGVEFPFVFGGDGASFLIPPSCLEAVEAELMALQALSINRFDLELRVSVMSVSDLYQRGAQLDVGKFKENLSGGEFSLSGKQVGVFRGGGLTVAEKILKQPDNPYLLTANENTIPHLNDLSCRWEPVPNRNGSIVSLMVSSALEDQEAAYRNILNKLEEILGGPLESVNPIHNTNLRYRGFWQCVKDESRYFNSWLSLGFLRKMLGILMTVVSFKLKIHILFDPNKFRDSIPRHSDYRKFDDSLRMIIDCTIPQVDEIRRYLEKSYQDGELFYGLHLSEASLMTCYVQSVQDADHIHFVDGGNGGYAAASKQLKRQLSVSRASQP